MNQLQWTASKSGILLERLHIVRDESLCALLETLHTVRDDVRYVRHEIPHIVRDDTAYEHRATLHGVFLPLRDICAAAPTQDVSQVGGTPQQL